MNIFDQEIYNAAIARLHHYNAKKGDRILVVADSSCHEPLVQAIFAAACAVSGDAILMEFKAREQPYDWEIPPVIEQAIYAADFTFSLIHPMWYYNKSSQRIQGFMMNSDKQLVSWEGRKEAVGHFISLVPGDEGVIERSKKIGKLLHEAKNIRITSRNGTHLLFERGNPQKQLMLNVPGQTNYSPLSLESRLAIARGEHPVAYEVAQGTLMFQGAYRTLCPGPEVSASLVHKPVRIEIDRGRIVTINRENEHGIYLDDWFRSWQDPTVYYIDHLNIGVDHRIRLNYLDNLAVHFNYGGILLGFGVSFSSLRGDPGVYRAHAHIEIHLTNHTLYFDNHPILVDGEFTRESGLFAENRRLGTGAAWQEIEGHVLPGTIKF